MSERTQEKASGAYLADYIAHYQADAEAIVDPQAQPPVRFASEHRRLETLSRLLCLKPGQRLLDVGCGSGWFSARCSRAGARVSALDIGPTGVAGARRRYPEIAFFQVGDVYHLPFGGNSFDAAVLSEVVEHLEDIDAALKEVSRVLRPGGSLLVSVPYRETIVQHLCIHCNRTTPANAHLHHFDEQKLAAFLQRQELVVGQTVRLSNKLLELGGFPHWSRRWPYWSWCGVDRLFNRMIGKAGFLCMRATKTG